MMRDVFWSTFATCLATAAILAGTSVGEEIAPRSAWNTSKIRGKPTAPDPFRIELSFPELRFVRPTSIAEIPQADRLVVAEQAGKIFSFQKAAELASAHLVGDLSVVAGGSVSIKSVIFHPEFQRNRFLFVCYDHPGSGSRVSRFALSGAADPTLVSGSELMIIQWPAGGHGGGCLQFGPDGYLYISTGDGSGPNPPDRLDTGQDISDLLGAVLRVDVDRAEGEQNYSVPSDNPFVHVEAARPEIWAYGLRNPWKFGIDRDSGAVFVADNGWETWEMIHRLRAGSNCGWPIMEGRALLRTEVPRGPTPITPPVKDHPHSEANSVIGGPVYRSDVLADLNGTFVYGDYITGTIWGLKAEKNGVAFEHRRLVDTDLQIVAFTQGSQGEIYVLDFDRTGQIYRLLPSDEKDTSADFPRRLSATGLFASIPELVPADGVLPYAVISEPWMDGATASRWVAIPGLATVKLDASQPTESEFPDGTVFVKHIQLAAADPSRGPRPLETQVLHLERGNWNPYSYLWDERGSDAVLVEASGGDRTIHSSQQPKWDRTWHVGSVNECRLCHNAAAGVVLGFTAKQLGPVRANGSSASQLELLSAQRVLVDIPTESGPSLVDPHAQLESLDERARSYLHTNCGMCHHRNGPATISFYAHRDYSFDELNITKRPGIGDFGIRSPQLIFPGAPYNSIILYRMSKLGNGRMPYVGSRLVDSQGVALIEKWIKSLRGNDFNAASQPPVSAASTDQLIVRLSQADNQQPSPDHIDQLLTSTEGALALATALHRGDVAKANLPRIRESTARMKSDLRGLFEHFVPESERRTTLGFNPDPAKVLGIGGDFERGKLIFLSDDARCRFCHHADDPLNSVGPTLRDIRGKYEHASELLMHILNPSAKIDEKFATWTVLTATGDLISGLLEDKDEHAVRLRLSDKGIIQFPLADIELLKKSDRSIMPDGTLSDLTPQEAADLLQFLFQPERLPDN